MGARRDPRAEPSSVPPDEERIEKLGNLPATSMRLPRSEPAGPNVDANEDAASEGKPPERVGATTGRVVTSADPRLELVEGALATGDWRKVASDLGTLDKAGGLPPTLGLVCALAHREIARDGEERAQE